MLAKHKWGYGLTLWDAGAFKVKLLRFKPWKACSLQYHSNRNELWLFLKGKGSMFDGANTSYVEAGKWSLVKAFNHHRFKAHDFPVWVLEIQYGTECVEEDIVRL